VAVRLVPPGLMALFDRANCTEVLQARAAEDRFDQSRPYVTRIYRRRFYLTTAVQIVGPLAVREAFKQIYDIQIGSYYQLGTGIELWSEFDMLSRVTSIVCQPYSEDGCGWQIDVLYEPIDPAQFAAYENPLLAPPEISFDGEHFEKILEKGAAAVVDPYKPDQPVQNSAHDPFDPAPTRDDTRLTMVLRVNVPDFDANTGVGFSKELIPAWQNSINKFEWFGFEKLTVKVHRIGAQLQWHPSLYDPTATPPNPGRFWSLTLTLQHNPDTWVKKILDQGYRSWDTGTSKPKNIIIDGVPATAPVLLDGQGQQATAVDPETLAVTPHYIEVLPYPCLAFGAPEMLGFGGP
jgi:hypothetical protein